MQTRTLGEYLKIAGVVTTPEPAQQPKQAAAAPAQRAPQPKQASVPANHDQPGTEPTDGRKPRDDSGEKETQDTGGTNTPEKEENKGAQAPVMYDPNIIKTAAQKALLDLGILVPDPQAAEALYRNKVAEVQATKKAHIDKMASEMEARGALMYHGWVKQATADGLARGEATMDDVYDSAALIGCSPEEILSLARQKHAQLTAARPASAFFRDQLGSGARVNSSHVMQASEANNNTTEFNPNATAGTRGPVEGPDERALRMTDTVTLPGNPGVNHGQKVDQGRSYR